MESVKQSIHQWVNQRYEAYERGEKEHPDDVAHTVRHPIAIYNIIWEITGGQRRLSPGDRMMEAVIAGFQGMLWAVGPAVEGIFCGASKAITALDRVLGPDSSSEYDRL